ncbi:MAG: TldD/PmbA family protein [Spirochaetia bacterium]|nr:TldD/PmbA family protein [Spirochaetia bacterium]
MNILESLDELKKEAQRQNLEFDAIAEEKFETGLELFKGKVIQTEVASSTGVGIRVIKNKRCGFSFTEKLSAETVKEMINNAVENAQVSDETELETASAFSLPEKELEIYNEELEKVDLNYLKNMALEIEENAYNENSLIKNIPHLGMGKSFKKTYVLNSQGVFFEKKSNAISGGLSVYAEKNGSAKSGYYVRGGRKTDIFIASEIAKEAVARAVDLLEAKPVKSGKYPVVFSNRTASRLFSMFLSSFFAENVQKGQSRLAGKLGQKTAVDNLSLISDPHLINGAGSTLFDDEGTIAEKLYLIKDGTLESYLYNLESAAKENRKSTGHGKRGYASQVSTGIWNILLEKSDAFIDDLLSSKDKCLYITELEGGAGCSQVSGEISIGAQGFLIEKGQKIRPVDEITLSANFFELLLNIEMISNSYSDDFSKVKIPDLLVQEIHVAG